VSYIIYWAQLTPLFVASSQFATSTLTKTSTHTHLLYCPCAWMSWSTCCTARGIQRKLLESESKTILVASNLGSESESESDLIGRAHEYIHGAVRGWLFYHTELCIASKTQSPRRMFFPSVESELETVETCLWARKLVHFRFALLSHDRLLPGIATGRTACACVKKTGSQRVKNKSCFARQRPLVSRFRSAQSIWCISARLRTRGGSRWPLVQT